MKSTDKDTIGVPAARILLVFLENPATPRYVFELMQRLQISSGVLYQILVRFERAGWITGEYDDIDPRTINNPPRRHYVLTQVGIEKIEHRLAGLRISGPPESQSESGV